MSWPRIKKAYNGQWIAEAGPLGGNFEGQGLSKREACKALLEGLIDRTNQYNLVIADVQRMAETDETDETDEAEVKT